MLQNVFMFSLMLPQDFLLVFLRGSKMIGRSNPYRLLFFLGREAHDAVEVVDSNLMKESEKFDDVVQVAVDFTTYAKSRFAVLGCEYLILTPI